MEEGGRKESKETGLWKNVQRSKLAGFEDGKWGPQAKEGVWFLAAGKTRKQVGGFFLS